MELIISGLVFSVLATFEALSLRGRLLRIAPTIFFHEALEAMLKLTRIIPI